MGGLVSDPFNAVEELLHNIFGGAALTVETIGLCSLMHPHLHVIRLTPLPRSEHLDR
jgi:hypothetical protein